MKSRISQLFITLLFLIIVGITTMGNAEVKTVAQDVKQEDEVDKQESTVAEENNDENVVDLHYFYDNPCASCDDEKEIFQIASEEIIDSEVEYRIKTYNIFEVHDYETYLTLLAEYGIKDTSQDVPLLLVNGTILSGTEVIRSRINEQLLVASEEKEKKVDVILDNQLDEEMLFSHIDIDSNKNTGLYFYRISCPDCQAVEEQINQVEADELELLKFNTRSGRNGDRIRLLFEQYQVPEEDQVVPIIFFADTYLAGEEDIKLYLQDYIVDGRGVGISIKN